MLNSIFDIRAVDDFSRKNTLIHEIHPSVKLVATMVYLFAVLSAGKYEISRLLPFALYPVVVTAFAEIPASFLIKRVLIVEPIVIAAGILSPFFDANTFVFAGKTVSAGWLTLFSLFMKCALSVSAALLFLSTTGMEKAAYAMRTLKIPNILVTQIMLTYRYIAVLMDEVSRTMTAYWMRSSGGRSLELSEWGSLPGRVLLRSIDRAGRVHTAMLMRGFSGEFTTEKSIVLGIADFFYFIFWTLFFISASHWNLTQLLGSIILSGAVK